MIVLHAVWSPGGAGAGEGVALWAEDGDRPRRLAPRRGRPPRTPRPRPHPFALDAGGVRTAVSELGGFAVDDLVAGEERELILGLPGTATGPLPSPWLEDPASPGPSSPGPSSPDPAAPVPSSGIPPEPEGASPTGPAVADVPAAWPAWVVPAIVVDPARAVELLAILAPSFAGAAPFPGSELSDVVAATDLRFAARAAELVVELVARGRIVPSLEQAPEPGAGRWQARWRPVVDGADRERIGTLVAAAPASFATAGGDDPDEALRAFFWATTDALARQLAPPLPAAPPPPRRGRRPARTTVASAPAPSAPSASAASAAADAWTSALSGEDPTVDADPGALTALAAEVCAWHATRSEGTDLLRVCFRVVPPGEGGTAVEPDLTGTAPSRTAPSRAGVDKAAPGVPVGADEWRIEFALQATDDPSLVVPASAVWTGGPELAALAHHVDHPDEHLLRGLGLASRLIPALAPSLSDAAPSELATDATGILAFLREGAPILEEAGFGVLAPPWWRSSKARLGLRLKARTRTKGGSSTASIGLGGLCDVQWEVALGDDTIGVTELRRLARLKQPLVRVRGQWVELGRDDLEAAIAAVGKRGAPADQLTAGEVLRTALGIEQAHAGLPVTDVVADGWLGGLLDGADDRRLEPVSTPAGFNGELRPYQERGLGWLSFLGDLGLGACLADDMGLGKTAQLLAVLVAERTLADASDASDASANRQRTRATVASPGPTLVLCPMSLVGNWEREAARFAPKLSVLVHHGPERLTGKAFTRRAAKTDLVLSTYGVAVRDHELLSTVGWNRLVLDEAQQIKNSATRVTQSVRSIPAVRRIAMTGTPVENRLSELWSIMQFLNPGLLGSEKAFRDRFAAPIERQGDDEAAARLRRVTGPFILRRLKTDRSIIADLPDKLEMKEYCTLTREQATLYQAVVEDMLARIEESEGIERRGLVLATMMKLKQVCNHPAHFLADGSALPGRSGKLTRLVEVLEEAVAEGDRSLVFTQFTEMGGMLERHLRHRLGCEVLWLHGGVPKKARDAMVQRFQGEDGPPVFLLSLKAGGTGLNLTAATQVIHYDRWWNPAVENQATDRAYRIGQTRTVQVRKFVCGGTLEERIDAMIDQKRALAERIVGTGEGWITELSTDQLRDVIALSADAVGEE